MGPRCSASAAPLHVLALSLTGAIVVLGTSMLLAGFVARAGARRLAR